MAEFLKKKGGQKDVVRRYAPSGINVVHPIFRFYFRHDRAPMCPFEVPYRISVYSLYLVLL